MNKLNIAIVTLLLAGVTFLFSAETKIKTNMHCGACKTKIENALKSNAGVESATADVESKVVTIAYNDTKTTEEDLKKSISDLGFSAESVKSCDTKDAKACDTKTADKKSCDAEKKACCTDKKDKKD